MLYSNFVQIDLSNNPYYIFNKTTALTGAFGIFCAYMLSSLAKFNIIFAKKYSSLKRFFGLGGFYFIFVHVFFAFRLIEPVMYSAFFDETGDIATRGQIIILLGAVAFLLFMFPAITSMEQIVKKLSAKRWLLYQRIGYFAYLIVFFHVFIMSYNEFFIVTDSLILPKSSLLMMILIITALIMRVIALIKLRK